MPNPTRPPGLIQRYREELQARHYARRTVATYEQWLRRFLRFHGMRHPREMGSEEVNAFLTHLAVEGNVSASTQNQALAALLFLYRELLERDLDLEGVVRARQKRRLPVVLAFFFAEAVCHIAVNALAAIYNVPSTGKLAPPALQRGEANTQQQGQFSGTSTSGNTLIHDLQSLLAVFGRGQSSASSPQKAWIFFAANSSAAASASAFSLRRSSCHSVGEAFG